ncbi:MAG: hypothetical protein ABJH72_13565 [Reichenbachiella sp.]|uniref:hypothetical protein n=1 Tax=Reichenbachiella sp. TaxID=2184521 RepID=UPI0032666CB5
MNRLILTTLVLLLPSMLFAQVDPYEKWDKNYTEIDLSELLNSEQMYADSIESNFDETQQLYFRAEKYRFVATFTGNWRAFSDQRESIMSFVFKMIGVDQSITRTIKNEIELVCQFGKIWMPIQPQLEKSFKKEVKKNADVYLYTLFLNSHSSKGLSNIFFVSEFISEQN